jgi:competence protein ComEC
MCSFALVGRVLGRRACRWRSLGLSLLAMALVDPLVAFDVSFVLSALATIGIVTLARVLGEAVARFAAPAPLRAAVATTLAATVACAPVLATLAPELPAGGLVANLVAVPVGEALALPLCLAHALASPVPAVERGSAAAASGALLAVRFVARVFAGTSVPVPSPAPEQLAVLALVAVGSALGPRKRRAAILAGGAALLSLLEFGQRRAGAPHGALRATFLDVGQGDAALVDLPDGGALLIDGGGLVGSPFDVGARVVGPVLSARRRSERTAVLRSHPHPDHFLGLGAALRRVRAGALWDTGQGETEGTGPPYATLLAELRRRGTPVLRPGDLCGTRLVGGAYVDVLAPCPGASPDRGPNDNSFVVRIRLGQRAILFAGDAERAEEGDLLAHGAERLRADVLKVGHHGSRTSSTPAFVAAVSPVVAVVSCGVRNRFGHPNAETLETLREAGAAVFRTDRDGSVIVTTDGDALSVRTAAGIDDQVFSALRAVGSPSARPQVRSTTPMYGRLR